MADLFAEVRRRLLAQLKNIALGSHCALMLDEDTLRIVSASVRMSELLEEVPSITVVESIHAEQEARAPASLAASMDVIYFLSPSAVSLRVALSDFPTDGLPVFGGRVHLIFTRRLPDALMDELRRSAVVAHVATLREVNLHFVPLARTAYSLDAPHALSVLYGPMSAAARAAALDDLAEQVCTVYSSLGQAAPRVRFSSQGHPVCRAFAERLDAKLRNATAASAPDTAATAAPAPAPTTPPAAATRARSTARRSTLLILERGFDPLTPLVHDFSYEALAEALGLLVEGRYVRSDEKAVLLDETTDPMWADMRRLPFERVPERLKEHSDAFLADNEAIVKAQRGDAMSLERKQAASRAQFAFSFVRRREHLKVHQELVTALTRRLLGERGERTPLYERLSLEQDLLTGRALDGHEIKSREAIGRVGEALAALAREPHASGVHPPQGGAGAAHATTAAEGATDAATDAAATTGRLVDSPAVRSHQQRCRLLALLSICRPLVDSDVAELLKQAELPLHAHVALARALIYMGQPLQPPLRAAPASQAAGARDDDEEEVELGRHSPRLRALLETALSGTLSTKLYPYLDGDDEDLSDPSDPFGSPGGDGSLASPRAELVGSWAFKRRAATGGVMSGSIAGGLGSLASPRGGLASPRGAPAEREPPGFGVLLLGGASHAELRAAVEVGGGGKVAFGCTALCTPLQYLHALQQMGCEGHGDGGGGGVGEPLKPDGLRALLAL